MYIDTYFLPKEAGAERRVLERFGIVLVNLGAEVGKPLQLELGLIFGRDFLSPPKELLFKVRSKVINLLNG